MHSFQGRKIREGKVVVVVHESWTIVPAYFFVASLSSKKKTGSISAPLEEPRCASNDVFIYDNFGIAIGKFFPFGQSWFTSELGFFFRSFRSKSEMENEVNDSCGWGAAGEEISMGL